MSRKPNKYPIFFSRRRVEYYRMRTLSSQAREQLSMSTPSCNEHTHTHTHTHTGEEKENTSSGKPFQ